MYLKIPKSKTDIFFSCARLKSRPPHYGSISAFLIPFVAIHQYTNFKWHRLFFDVLGTTQTRYPAALTSQVLHLAPTPIS